MGSIKNYTHGMICPACSKQNGFRGAHITPIGDQLGYTCECGFHAALLIPGEKHFVEYRFKKEQ